MKNFSTANSISRILLTSLSLISLAGCDLQGQQTGDTPPANPLSSSPQTADASTETPAAVVRTDEDYFRYAGDLKNELKDTDFVVRIEKPFIVIGNESPDAVASHCERTIRWAVEHLKPMYFENDPEVIIEVWLFRDKETYEQGCRDLIGRAPTTPFGFYSAANQKLIMNISTGGGTLVHELVHPFIARNFPGCPAWFNEGLASLYEQCGSVEGRMEGFTNWRLRGLQKTIEAQRLPTMQSVMETSTRDFYGDNSGTHYAVARYLCYFLQEQGKLNDFYHAFRQNVGTDPTGVETLKEIIGQNDLGLFQPEWEKWAAALVF